MLDGISSLMLKDLLPQGALALYDVEREHPYCLVELQEKDLIVRRRLSSTENHFRVDVPLVMGENEYSSIEKFSGEAIAGLVNEIHTGATPSDLIADIERKDLKFHAFMSGPCTWEYAKMMVPDWCKETIHACEGVQEGVLYAVTQPEYLGRIPISHKGLAGICSLSWGVSATYILDFVDIEQKWAALDELWNHQFVSRVMQT